MRTVFITLSTIIILTITGCCSVVVISDPEALNQNAEIDCQVESICEECFIEPYSGEMKDQRKGYYYDPVEEKCKEIIYSSGGVPAPFKTLKECICCCEEYKNK